MFAPSLTFRPARRPDDIGRTLYFTTIDWSIPLVVGITVVCRGNDEVAQVLHAASEAGLAADVTRYQDGRRAVAIEPLTPAITSITSDRPAAPGDAPASVAGLPSSGAVDLSSTEAA